mgnify:CR=1 FL=1
MSACRVDARGDDDAHLVPHHVGPAGRAKVGAVDATGELDGEVVKLGGGAACSLRIVAKVIGDDGKVVSAKACGKVVAANAFDNACGSLPEQGVPDVVPECVV